MSRRLKIIECSLHELHQLSVVPLSLRRQSGLAAAFGGER
jgi:hypothetical protein